MLKYAEFIISSIKTGSTHTSIIYVHICVMHRRVRCRVTYVEVLYERSTQCKYGVIQYSRRLGRQPL
jgi:hypothetical protein